jgi:hypothetical protein
MDNDKSNIKEYDLNKILIQFLTIVIERITDIRKHNKNSQNVKLEKSKMVIKDLALLI